MAAQDSQLCSPRSLGPRHPPGLGMQRQRACHPSRASHSSPFWVSGNSSLPFFLFRKQKQSQTPVLGEGWASAPQEWLWERALSTPPLLTTTVLTLPSLPPSLGSGGRAEGPGKTPWSQGASRQCRGPWLGPGLRRPPLELSLWSGCTDTMSGGLAPAWWDCTGQVTHVLLCVSVGQAGPAGRKMAREVIARGWGWRGGASRGEGLERFFRLRRDLKALPALVAGSC